MTSFSSRLQSIMQQGNLTGADLSRWFDRPDPTVRYWIRGNHELTGPALDVAYVEAQLVKLEKLLKRKKGLPVPRMALTERIAYLAKLKKF